MKIEVTEDQRHTLYKFVERVGEEYDNLFEELFGEQLAEIEDEEERDEARSELEDYLTENGLRV